MIEKIDNKEIIEKLFKEIFNEDLKLNIYSNIIVYKELEEIIGFLIYDLIYERCEIDYIAVKKEFRNKSVASKMIEFLLKENKNITLEVNVKNEAAINLYKKYGFKVVAKREKYYKGEDGYLMSREV